MDNKIMVDPKTFAQELDKLRVANDGDGFLALALVVKSTAIDLMERNRHWEAKEMMEAYSGIFFNESHRRQSPDFIFKTLEFFPVNHHSTMYLLGVSRGVDDYILEHKLIVDRFEPTEDSGYEDVIDWAMRKNDWRFVETFVRDLVKRTHDATPDEEKPKRSIANGLVDALIRHEYADYQLANTVDEDIASLINSGADYRRSGAHIVQLADRGLAKTLMKMMEHGMLGRATSRSQDDFGVILRCIPQELTLQQLYAVHYHLEVSSFAEKLLFNEGHSMEDFIAVLKDSHYGMYTKSDLDIGSLQAFSHLITPKNFEIRERRTRILQLIDASMGKGTAYEKMSTDEIRKKLGYNNVPPFTFKHIHRLKGTELEDAMGL